MKNLLEMPDRDRIMYDAESGTVHLHREVASFSGGHGSTDKIFDGAADRIEGANVLKPSPIALVVCDNIYREPTGKTALVGLFKCITASSFPATHARLTIYAAVTDVHPGTKFRIRIEHSETQDRVAEIELETPKEVKRTAVCDLNFILNFLKFVEPGRYFIQFWGGGHLLLQRPFDVTLMKAKEEHQ